MHHNTLTHHGVKGMKWGVRKKSYHTIKAGTSLQRITTRETEDLSRPFYAAYTQNDKTRYAGVYGQLLSNNGQRTVYNKQITSNEDFKIATRKTASKEFSELYRKDPKFREAFHASNKNVNFDPSWGASRNEVLRKSDSKLSRRGQKTYGYDAFNIGLINSDANGRYIRNTFYSELAKKGYHGIVDINDQKYDNHKTEAPVIIFKTPETVVISSKTMTMSEINEAAATAYGRDYVNKQSRFKK